MSLVAASILLMIELRRVATRSRGVEGGAPNEKVEDVEQVESDENEEEVDEERGDVTGSDHEGTEMVNSLKGRRTAGVLRSLRSES